MPQQLKSIRVDEVSLVDHPANPGARVVLAKRRGLAARIMALFKDAGDDPRLFDDAQADAAAEQYAGDLLARLGEAVDALLASIQSIREAEGLDQQALLDETFRQFRTHLDRLVPEEIEKALAAAGIAAALGSGTKGSDMTEEIRKALGLAPGADDAAAAAAIRRLKAELALAKMDPAHKAYMDEAEMDPDQRAEFAAMSDDERAAHIRANPLEKSLPEAVLKRLAAGDEALHKLARLEDERALAELTRRVAGFGVGAEVAKDLHAMAKAAPEAARALEATLRAFAEQARAGKLFAEFGGAQGGDATSAIQRMFAKADALMKADPRIRSREVAIAKIAADPAEAELWAAYKAENAVAEATRRTAGKAG